jgi:hypothetical protein
MLELNDIQIGQVAGGNPTAAQVLDALDAYFEELNQLLEQGRNQTNPTLSNSHGGGSEGLFNPASCRTFTDGWYCFYSDGSAIVNTLAAGETSHVWLSPDRTQSSYWETDTTQRDILAAAGH